MGEVDDAKLLLRACNGNESAFLELFARYQRRIYERNNRERSAFRVVDDEIRKDAPELERAIRQILARVAEARSLGEQPEGVLKRVVHLQGYV